MNTQSQFTFHGAAIRDAKLLPIQPPGQVIGRNNELKSMHLALKAGASVFVSGPAGIGKTALASVLATAYTASNPGGVLWFNCIEDDLEQLIARVGRAFGINAADNTAAIRAVLVKNRPLIVFDGLIDIDAARKFVGEIGQGIATILVNDISGSGPWLPIGLEPLSNEDSVAILKYYSGLQDEVFELDLEGLCKFLGGLPLAIELAGRHVAIENITPGELLTRLPSSTGQDAAAMMMSVIFKRIPPATQGLLLVLSATFTGSASAELMSDLSSAPIPTIIPLMRQLVARAIARESLSYGQFAYRVHQSIQEYARIWLESYRRLQSTESRALDSIIAYVERHARNTVPDHDRLAAEIDNIVGAAAYATETGQAAVLRQLTDALAQSAGGFVALRGFGPELAQMRTLATLLSPNEYELTEPLQAVRPELFARPSPAASGEPPLDTQATPVVKRVVSVPKPPPDLPSFPEPDTTEPVVAEPLTGAVLDETQLASPVPPDLLPGAKASEPPPESALPPSSPEEAVPTPESSLAALEQKITEAEATGDLAGQASLLQTLGKAYADLGNHAQALVVYKQALDVYERLESPQGVLATLEAMVQLDTSVDDSTFGYATRAAEQLKKEGPSTQLGRLYHIMGDMQITRGEFPSAIDNYRQAVECLQGSEDWNTLGDIMNKLGTACLAENQPQEAATILEQALTIFRHVQRPDDERQVLASLATAYRKLMQWDKSRDYYEKSIASALANNDQQVEADQLEELASVYSMQGDMANTVTHYWRALHVAFQTGNTAQQARIALQLGRVLIEDTRTLGQGLELLRDSDSVAPSMETKRLLSRATKRVDRASAAGVIIPPAEYTNRDYAAKVYEGSALSAQASP